MSQRVSPADREDASLDPYGDPRLDLGSRLTVLECIRRRPFVTAMPIILLVAAALAYGLVRSPNYTAENRLSVAQLNLSEPGALNGYASATTALASAYSRAVNAQAVVDRVAQETGLPAADVRTRIFATPIPDSPVFRILAKGTSAEQAVTLANVSGTALLDYVRATNSEPNPATPELLKEYRAAQLKVSRASQAFNDARRQARIADTSSNRRVVTSTEADLSSARLRAQNISEQYTQSSIGALPGRPFNFLAPATVATSDRSSRLQIFLFAGLVGGVVLGAALALLLEDRRLRRTLRQAS